METSKNFDVSEATLTNENGSLKEQNEPVNMLKNSNLLDVYTHDVVRSKISGVFGLVTAGNVYGDEDEYEDEQDLAGYCGEGVEETNGNSNEKGCEHGSVIGDRVVVHWIGGFEDSESVDDVTVVDRVFKHGYCVASVTDPTGQTGIVVDVHISVDLLAEDGSYINDKPSRELKRVSEFAVGDYVVLRSWLGKITDVLSDVTVLLGDGSVCKVSEAQTSHLEPVGNDFLYDYRFPYYPGQRVITSSGSSKSMLEGTVTEVTAGVVFVNWIASAGYGPDSTYAPAEMQSPQELKLLSCFAHTDWQFGDRCLLHSSSKSLSSPFEEEYSSDNKRESTETGDEYDAKLTITLESTGNSMLVEDNSEFSMSKISETSDSGAPPETNACDNLVYTSKEVVSDSRSLQCKGAVTKEKEVQKKVEWFERALRIVNTKTTVDVVWQDGTVSWGLKSTSLIQILGNPEFAAEQYIVEKPTDDSNEVAEFRRAGVVKSVDAKHRTACVKWLKDGDLREFDKEEVVSLYELEWHPDYNYWYGDVVFRLSPVPVPAILDSSVCSIEDNTYNSADESRHYYEGLHDKSKSAKTMSTHDISTDFSDLSWVGNIVALRNGDLEVMWADGRISTVGPHEIYVVIGDYYDNTANSETFEDGVVETVYKTNEEHGRDNDRNVRPKIEDNMVAAEYPESSNLSILLAAFAFLRRQASGIFYFLRGRKIFDPLNAVAKSDEDVHFDRSTPSGEPEGGSSSKQHNDINRHCSKLKENHGNEVSDSVELVGTLHNSPDSDAPLLHDVTISAIKSFDIARNPSDHYFLDTRVQNNASRKWFKKVQQDWAILQNNLPEGIYVRAYEDRMDLLRAVIVGAYGTPYQDGLFSFDFQFPQEYPDVPPLAYYHSGGWRINPNLYEEGKVCLSLLNTWTGRGSEVWDPSTSSILQVLVSLQGLVLNSEPYFNEPGYEKQAGTAEGQKQALFYNENTFILNCKMMMYLMRKPRKDFEEVVTGHFRKRGYYILKACDAYMQGHPIGSLAEDASITSDSNAATNTTSAGFKLMLGKVVPKLLSALIQAGTDCQEFKHMMQYS